MRKNFLYVTTRQFNPGDEFILMGVDYLLYKKYGEQNRILFNKNPEVISTFSHLNFFRKYDFTKFRFPGIGFLLSFLKIGFNDNSYNPFKDFSEIDRVIFCGSPDWYSNRQLNVFKAINKLKIPVEFHGLGSQKSFNLNNLGENCKLALKSADFISCRDNHAYNTLKKISKPLNLTCPALFVANKKKQIKSLKNIGIIFAHHDSCMGNRISKNAMLILFSFYNKLISKYQNKFSINFICHHSDEIQSCKKYFPDIDFHYDYDSKNYQKIYSKFDLVIGSRLHGIAMACSMGIPSIGFSHDFRGSAAERFGALNMNINDINQNKIFDILNEEKFFIQLKNNIHKNYSKKHNEYLEKYL